MGCCLPQSYHRLALIPRAGCYSCNSGQTHEVCSVHSDCYFLVSGRVHFPLHPIHHSVIQPPIGNDSGQRCSLGLNSRSSMPASPPIHLSPPPAQQADRVTEPDWTLEIALHAYVMVSKADWAKWLPTLAFTYNSTPQMSMGYSPFFLLYGHKPRSPASLATKDSHKVLRPLHNQSAQDFVQEL